MSYKHFLLQWQIIYTDTSQFQVFRRFFLRKVWLLIVPYLLNSKKLPVPSRTFGLAACHVIITTLGRQKLVFLLWAQIKVLEKFVNDSFSWGTFKITYSIKIDNIVTSNNSGWGLVRALYLENIFLWFKVKTKTLKRIKAIIVFQVDLQKPFF